MLTELLETTKLAENLSWPIARGAFAVAMHRVEDESTMWADTHFLAENRLTFNGSITLSPRPSQNNKLPTQKRIVCRWFNVGMCPHSQDHNDSSGAMTFRHICSYCFRVLKRNNSHPESECLNKRKTAE